MCGCLALWLDLPTSPYVPTSEVREFGFNCLALLAYISLRPRFGGSEVRLEEIVALMLFVEVTSCWVGLVVPELHHTDNKHAGTSRHRAPIGGGRLSRG